MPMEDNAAQPDRTPVECFPNGDAEPAGQSRSGGRRSRPIVRLLDAFSCYIVCGLLFAALDAWRVRWVLAFGWLPASEVWPPIAYSAATYAACAAIGAAAGWTLWLCACLARLRRPWLRAVLTSAAPPFAFTAIVWGLAAPGQVAEPGSGMPGPVPPQAITLWVGRVALASLLLGAVAGLLGACGRRWRFARAALTLAAVAGVAAGVAALPQRRATAHPSADRPNIVLITVDALRGDYLSCYGGPVPTPHLDAIAAGGAKFTHVNSASPWTRPSVSSLMMSVYPTVHGVGENDLGCWRTTANVAPDVLTFLAEALQSAGYSTGAFVCNAQVDGRFGFSRGFDDYVMFEHATRPLPCLRLTEAVDPGMLLSRRARHIARGRLRQDSEMLYASMPGQAGVYLEPSGLFLVGAAIRWMRSAKPPFFVWIHLMEVNQYGNVDMPLSKPPSAGGLAGLRQLARHVTPGGRCLLGPDDYEKLMESPDTFAGTIEGFIGRYKTNVAYADALLGCLLADIDAAARQDDTLVVLSSDHGEEFGDHGGTWHGWTEYEEVTRVPLLMRGPRIGRAGTVVDEPCSLIDVAPTLLDVAGVPPPMSFRGKSLLPMIAGRPGKPREVCSEFMTPERPERKALRYEMFKCITATAQKPAELYDLREDPHEKQNLADTLPYRLKEMLARLDAWQERQLKMARVARKRNQKRFVMDEEMRDMLKSLGYLE